MLICTTIIIAMLIKMSIMHTLGGDPLLHWVNSMSPATNRMRTAAMSMINCFIVISLHVDLSFISHNPDLLGALRDKTLQECVVKVRYS